MQDPVILNEKLLKMGNFPNILVSDKRARFHQNNKVARKFPRVSISSIFICPYRAA